MWRIYILVWLAGCGPGPATEDTHTDDVLDSGPPDTFVVVGGVEEHGERHCPDASARDSHPLFAPPITGDFAGTQVRGSTASTTGWGMSVADFDLDGHLDLFLPQNTGGQLYRGRGNGAFDLAELAFPVGDGAPATGSSSADFDADGDLDLFVARPGPDRLLRNDGGTFVDVTPAGMSADLYDSIGGAWADYDDDGDLDLFVPNWWTHGLRSDTEAEGLWQGDPNVLWESEAGAFLDNSERLGAMPDASVGFTFIGGWWDVDGDRRPELHVVNDKGYTGYGISSLALAWTRAFLRRPPTWRSPCAGWASASRTSTGMTSQTSSCRIGDASG